MKSSLGCWRSSRSGSSRVCADLTDPDTRRRALRALDGAMVEFGVDRGVLVTRHQEESIDVSAGRVRIVPAWRWLLEGVEPG
jgi:predicted AAA+ superfamily ATPase